MMRRLEIGAWLLMVAGASPAWAGGTRLVFEPSDMPPTRTICEVSTPSVTSTLEWDAASMSPLRQTLVLPPDAANKATVRCWSRLPPFGTSDGAVLALSQYWEFPSSEELVWPEPIDFRPYTDLLEGVDAWLDQQSTGPLSSINTVPHFGTKTGQLGAPAVAGWTSSLRTSRPNDPLFDALADELEYLVRCSAAGAGGNCPTTLETWRFAVNEAQRALDTVSASTADVDTVGATVLGPAAGPPARPKTAKIEIRRLIGQPSLQARLHTLDTALSGSSSNRSLFNPVPEAVSATATVLGEIALKRAEARTREALISRITDKVCEDGIDIYDRWVSRGGQPLPFGGTGWGLKMAISQQPGGDWELTCDANNTPVPVLSYKGPATGFALHSSCANYLSNSTAPGAPHLSFTTPTGPPKDADAVVMVEARRLNGSRAILSKGRHAQTFGFRLDQTCAVVKDRPFADLARSGRELARALQADLLQTGLSNLGRLQGRAGGGTPSEFDGLLREVITPLLETTVPVVLEAAQEGRAPTAREAQAMLGALRQRIKGTTKPELRTIELGLAVLADCVDAGVCDLRQVAAKIASFDEYYEGTSGIPPLSDEAQQLLVGMVDDFYTVFAPDPEITERQRVSAAVGAMFDTMQLAVHIGGNADDAGIPGLVTDVLEDMRRISLASIEEDLAQVAIHSTSLVTHLVQLVAHDKQCSPPAGTMRKDERYQCVQGLERTAERMARVLPWVSTLVAHAEQYKDERDGDLTEAELEDAAAARQKALEDLIDASTGRKDRDGEWVVSLGANVGFRFARSWDARRSGLPVGPHGLAQQSGWSTTPVTVPIGLSLQRLPHAWARDGRARNEPDRKRARWKLEELREHGELPRKPFGVGFHLQASPVDAGQLLRVDDQLGQVTWNEFLVLDLQAGVLIGTSRDAFSVGLDYRYVPGEGLQGAHQVGIMATYYVPLFDLN